MDQSATPPAPAVKPIDYTPLTEPVTAQQVAAFRRQANANGWSVGALDATAIITVVALAFFAVIALFVLSGTIAAAVASGSGFGALVSIAFIAVFVLIAVVILRGVFGNGGRWRRWYRLSGFAAANGLGFNPKTGDPGFGGAIFGMGDDRGCDDRLFRNEARRLDIANYHYSTGSGKDRTTHTWGYLALQLDRRLPNMILDAKSNNTLFGSNLPITLARDQKLSLEGDFDRYFTLYCPKEYERDALYVFTPDLMALLIDNSAQFDVEIVDDWMFLYSTTALNLIDLATMNHLFRIVDTVGAKTVTQTDRYSDDRISSAGANMVAPQGRRLRRGFPVAGAVIFVAFAAIWLWMTFGH